MEQHVEKRSLGQRYEVALIIVSVAITLAVVAGLTLFPEQGTALADDLLYLLTRTFGSFMQVFTVIVLVFLVALGVSKYGEIRLGTAKPKYRTTTWVAMMFFSGLGAGTVYWAFLEWGYHFNAAPKLAGAEISEAYAYELSLAYTLFDWGPSAWALLCVFALPFGYHYYIKKDQELRLSALCKYTLGEKRTRGFWGKLINLIFILAAVGSICISAGSSASTISTAVASLFGIDTSFALTAVILLGVALLYSVASLLGAEKGMSKISDWNTYFCIALLIFIALAGPTRFILDSLVNSLGLLFTEFTRMSLWTDPVAQTGYPQDWTVFYLVYWFVFGPFTGLFIAKISEGRKVKEIILNMILSGSAGLFLFFGIIGAYEQDLRIQGILDVPAMLENGQAPQIAEAVIRTLPFSKAAMALYVVVIILFLAAALNSCSFTLSSTVSRGLREGEEPSKLLKLFWCLVLIAIPLAVTYIGTNIDTIKSIVLATGLPLVIILFIIYYGFLRELKKDYGGKTRSQIISEGAVSPERPN